MDQVTKPAYSPARTVYKAVESPAIAAVFAALLPLVTHGKITPEAGGAIGVCVAGIIRGAVNWFKNRRQ